VRQTTLLRSSFWSYEIEPDFFRQRATLSLLVGQEILQTSPSIRAELLGRSSHNNLLQGMFEGSRGVGCTLEWKMHPGDPQFMNANPMNAFLYLVEDRYARRGPRQRRPSVEPTSAPASTSSLTTVSCPALATCHSGVDPPLLSVESTSAPASTSRLTTASCPASAARDSGVRLLSSVE
jgi:hypothetical protein